MRRQRLAPALAIGTLVAGAMGCGARPTGAAAGVNAPAALRPNSSSDPATNPTGASTIGAAPSGSGDTGGRAVAGSTVASGAAADTTGGGTGRGALPTEIAPAPRFTSMVYTVKNDPALRGCAASVKGPSDVANAAPIPTVATIAAIGAACAKATRMKPVSRPSTGDQSDAQLPQSFVLRARANHCYRVYAAAAAGIRDFTVALRDSAGAAIDTHASGGAAALPEGGAVCFQADDAATVVFSAGMGTGAFALQIWGD